MNLPEEDMEEDRLGFLCVEELAMGGHFMLEANKEGNLTKEAQVVFDSICKRNDEFIRKK